MRVGLRYISERQDEGGLEIEGLTEKDDGTVTFGGYILHWGDVANIRDLFGEYTEEFVEGAFTKTVKERGPNGNRAIKLLRQHDQKVAQAGKFTDLHEDNTGLAFEARTIKTSVGSDLAEEIREGVMTTMSVGFDSLMEEYDKERNHFSVLEARMYEASPVLWPAYQSGTIDQFRALEAVPALARFLTLLDAGDVRSEEVIGQLTMIRAKIATILDGPGATTPVEEQTETTEPEATAGNSHRSHEELLARLRLAEREHGLN